MRFLTENHENIQPDKYRPALPICLIINNELFPFRYIAICMFVNNLVARKLVIHYVVRDIHTYRHYFSFFIDYRNDRNKHGYFSTVTKKKTNVNSISCFNWNRNNSNVPSTTMSSRFPFHLISFLFPYLPSNSWRRSLK